MMETQLVGEIAVLAYTPIKSTALTEVESVEITPSGIVGDREWVIVRNEKNNEGVHRWVSQRDRRNREDSIQSLGILARINSKLTNDYLELSFDSTPSLQIPNNINRGTKLTIQIWKDIIHETIDQGDTVANWLSERLEYKVRLVKVITSIKRYVSRKYFQNEHRILGHDSYPLHWITQESLDELSRRAGQQLAWTRFRPNIVVRGTPHPNFEHTFFKGCFGDVPVVNAKPCDRCPVPLVDQETGKRVLDQEPLKTLSTYKRWTKPSGKIAIIFGEMALPLVRGTLKVGDKIVMNEIRNPPIQYQ